MHRKGIKRGRFCYERKWPGLRGSPLSCFINWSRMGADEIFTAVERVFLPGGAVKGEVFLIGLSIGG